ncbi:MAG: glycerol-3-phosphate dehydrogenase/oxidase [Bdellovibrionota bacterium]
MSFSFLDRKQIIKKMSETEYDVVIIGGGITGAGVARDAASRGMRVALVEASDFASGTSSRSSKLIHGGIRYLENMEFHLVFEALSERALLFKIAPHMVHPLRFLLPLYKGSRVGMNKMGLGMWLYDALSLFRAPKLHERLSAKKSVGRIPILQPKNLMGSFVYSDAYMDDDRLVIETLRSAKRLGADQISYVKAVGAKMTNEKVTALDCEDVLSGQKFTLKGKHFVSTVGPWTDILGESLLKTWKKLLRPSKGIHITLSKDRLPLPCAMVMATEGEKRIVFGIPRHEMIIIGTTDTDFKDNPSTVHSTKADVDYLLKVVEEYFPGAIRKEDILASYAGVRPLVHDGSETESKTSREHVILEDPRNITFVAGGKYTTYRKMAEQTVEKFLKNYSKADRKKFKTGNTKVALNPKVTAESFKEAQSKLDELTSKTHFSKNEIQILLDRHGSEAFDIVSQYYSPAQTSVWEMEAHFASNESMCGKLLDFYLRRVPLFLAEKDHGFKHLERLSQIFQQKLDWSEEERQLNIADVRKHESFELSWKK